MKLTLVDTNPDVFEALSEAFKEFTEVKVLHGNILNYAKNTLVSPANSHGFMDGGIDQVYLDFFGPEIQKKAQIEIKKRPEGLLPVGACLVINTEHPKIPYLAMTPTMEMPEAVDKQNAYRAFKAMVRTIGNDKIVGKEIYCPGLCTLTGRVSAKDAAQEMAEAYKDWKELHAR